MKRHENISQAIKTPLVESYSHRFSKWVSTSSALMCVLSLLIIWLLSGPYFHFEESWHVLITTGSAAITLVMVFVLTRAQAKDTIAMQIKLDEIILVLEDADNHLIKLENLTESEIKHLSQERADALAEDITQ